MSQWISRPFPLAAAFVLTMGSYVLVSDHAAEANVAPHPTIVPAVGLRAGEVVRVSGSGFRSHERVNLVECVRRAVGDSGCAVSTHEDVTASARGTFLPSRFKVIVGQIGIGTCGTNLRNVRNCAIVAGDNSGRDTARAPIRFKLTAS